MKLARILRRDPAAPTLRERLAGVTAGIADAKKRTARAAQAAQIAYQPPAPEPQPVDRLALINYATWLAHERRLLCHEIYPQAGPGADRFIAANVAADAFHFPHDHRTWRDVPQPSTRAVQALDRLGIDWRADVADRDFHDPAASHLPAGFEGRALPHGSLKTDGVLLTALADLLRLDALLESLPTTRDRDLDELPEYRALSDARDEVIGRLINERAASLPGLQAKARAILADGFRGTYEDALEIARGLARDLIGARHSAIEPRPDPILPALAEVERLEAVCNAEWAHDNSDDGNPARDAAQDAVSKHWRGVVLKTVPTTARGCAAFARFARAYHQRWAASLDPDGHAVLDLIARSPLL